MSPYAHGRHEHGQNFLTDPAVAARIVELLRPTTGRILEIGPGDGALTLPLATLNRPLVGVEIDAKRADSLARRVPPNITVVCNDFLRFPAPQEPHVVVGNVPFHLTTAILRRLLHTAYWSDAILLVQWEVARRRAGVGGATLMTAQWAPWFEFSLKGRVPASAFTPRPGVDAGLLQIRRRQTPLIADSERKRFQGMAHRIFTGRGRGIVEITSRAGLFASTRAAGRWAAQAGLERGALPRDLSTNQWVDLYLAAEATVRRIR